MINNVFNELRNDVIYSWGILAEIKVKIDHQKIFCLQFCSFLVCRYPLGRHAATPNFFALGPIFWEIRGFKILAFLGYP